MERDLEGIYMLWFLLCEIRDDWGSGRIDVGFVKRGDGLD